MADDENPTTLNPNDNMEGQEDTFDDTGGFFDTSALETPYTDRGGTSKPKVGFGEKTVLRPDPQDVDDDASYLDDEYDIRNQPVDNPKDTHDETASQDDRDEDDIKLLAGFLVIRHDK